MKLIDEGGLYDRMQELLAMSTSVDIAMAWVRCGKPLDAILSFAKAHPGKLRVLCGVNGFLTEADALFQLHETGQLKIAYGTSGMKLHSKMFLFRDYTSTTAWVGSANLTDSAFSLNRELVCEFQDNGTGEKIFEAYYTTKEKGTGLGLATVKHNVELYGGAVRLESGLGKGARFTLVFPAKALIKLAKQN